MADNTDLEKRDGEVSDEVKSDVKGEKEKKPRVEIDTTDNFTRRDMTEEMQVLSSEADLKAAEAEKKYIKATYAFDKNDIDEALMLIRSALALAPGNPKYHYNIGFLYWQKDLIEVALNHYKLFLRYAPENHKERQNIADRVTYLEKEIKTRRTRR